MKAKEYLKSKGLKNPSLDSGISGGGDAPRIYTSDIIEEYARIQIEKDREARQSDMELAYETLPVNSDYADAKGEGLLKAIKILKTAPINLD